MSYILIEELRGVTELTPAISETIRSSFFQMHSVVDKLSFWKEFCSTNIRLADKWYRTHKEIQYHLTYCLLTEEGLLWQFPMSKQDSEVEKKFSNVVTSIYHELPVYGRDGIYKREAVCVVESQMAASNGGHIVCRLPNFKRGIARIGATPVPVLGIIRRFNSGATPEEIVQYYTEHREERYAQMPALTVEDIQYALDYYKLHTAEIDADRHLLEETL